MTLVGVALLAVFAGPVKADKPRAVPIVVDTDDGPALRTKNGKFIYLDELSDDEKDALSLGDPALFKKGEIADERRDAAQMVLKGCGGDLKCWRLGMARWEAAGEEGGSSDEILKKRKDSRAAQNYPDSTEPEQVKKLCDQYDRQGALNNGENRFYENYCLDRATTRDTEEFVPERPAPATKKK